MRIVRAKDKMETVDFIAENEAHVLPKAKSEGFKTSPKTTTWNCGCGQSVAYYFEEEDQSLLIGVCSACFGNEI